ncbi:hypothetical protein M409DRAFT_17377 [Zasmidium cellare ATCC 36951]|uniref:Uncharacterized protein n=1 Tax=Zasmidium cellare ATCC 36951 TaxID=1080233 RepID=A0A6A6CY38_ZASCE|nr:uncharacterized protein M409DRAFT_17377 [Zasmidium cellare ATCC 36951]KAF2172137.1 hypothetical protein M409DRAFT_17377 [Zasmidium cellare ATCC 36951]
MWSPGTHVQYTDNINRIQSRLISNANEFFGKKACAPIFEDPVPEVLTMLNKLMFSTSVYATQELDEQDLFARIDPGLQISYDVQGLRIDAQPVFQTKWVFFWGAAAIQILCVVVVLSTFWDFWKLGRAASLSLLEIARAFDAELTRSHGCAYPEGWRLAEMQDIGERRVRYGLVGKHGRLGFGDIDTVRRPDRGSTFAG